MEIQYVHGLNMDINDPILRKILEFCDSRNITIQLRQYNAIQFEDDKEFVAKLPAIHIYNHKHYQDTIYPDFKPIHFLTMEHDKFELEELEKESKKQIWEERIKYLKSIFRSSKTDSNSSKSRR